MPLILNKEQLEMVSNELGRKLIEIDLGWELVTLTVNDDETVTCIFAREENNDPVEYEPTDSYTAVCAKCGSNELLFKKVE